MGGSALSQVFGQVGNVAPDVHEVQLLKDFADALEQLHDSGIVMAYHGKLAYYTRINHMTLFTRLKPLFERSAACFDGPML